MAIQYSLADIEKAIANELSLERAALGSEVRLHEAISRAFAKLGIAMEREKRLSARDRLDFFLPATGFVVEVKVGTAGYDALQQVSRYLEHAEVRGALVIANHAEERVPALLGKPLRYIELWKYHV